MIDWKLQSLTLAEKLYGIEKAASWKVEIEASAPVQPITQVRVKPNPVFATGRTGRLRRTNAPWVRRLT